MTGDNDDRRSGLPAEIRRHLGSPMTTRYLRSLPSMQVNADLPHALERLLAELDITERRPPRRRTTR